MCVGENTSRLANVRSERVRCGEPLSPQTGDLFTGLPFEGLTERRIAPALLGSILRGEKYWLFALLCWVLVYIWRRGIRPQDEPYLRRFILAPLSQHFLIIFSAVLSLFHRAPLGSYLLLGAMALCCVLADFLLFHGLRNYTNQQLARQQTELLEEQLRQQLAYYNGVVAHIEDTARLRHELRNQLQTVYALMERGEYDHAQELLTAFTVPLAAGEEVR